MFHSSLAGLDRSRLRLWLVLFFMALAIPAAILIQQAYSRLKWEAFHLHQVLAEELAARIDARFIELIDAEEARSFAEYRFLVVAGDPAAKFVQRSPLSAYPVRSAIPGLIGHFQVDAQGGFSTPLLPRPGTEAAAYGISAPERAERLALQHRVARILSRNRLVRDDKAGVAGYKASASEPPRRKAQRRDEQQEPALAAADKDQPAAAPAEEPVKAQAAFDQLKTSPARREKRKQEAARSLGQVEERELDSPQRALPGDESRRRVVPQHLAKLAARGARKERSALPEAPAPVLEVAPEAAAPAPQAIHISTFESELDPFEFSLLDSGHLVLFRKVWRGGQRFIQGALFEQRPFLGGVIESAFRETVLSRMSNLAVAYQGNVLLVFSGRASRRYASRAEAMGGALLYQTRLSAPLGDLELVFSVTRLPSGPGSIVITWVAAILALVLCGGSYLMYRLGVRQIDLARQQRDFVSAVSHELKTPLTSIRMYGEMLREGWAGEDKKQTYYDYIFHESERLSRLIANVLQLARMTRNDFQVELKPVRVAELMDGLRSKVSSHIERAGFQLRLDCDGEAAQAVIRVDADCFSQIAINLVDNAIKFSASAENRAIDIAWRPQRDRGVRFSVRDYGPGVPRDQMKKIFELFYRSENELTRETVGTGIGLALVHELALAMGGKVDVVNREPGAEFALSFTAQRSAPA